MATASPELSARYRLVGKQIDGLIELAAVPGLHAAEATEVSRWTVGKQLEHLLLSDETILDRFDRLQDGREGPDPGGPTMLGRLILKTGFIPRGFGKAPGIAKPAGRDAADIAAGLRRLRERVDELDEQLPLLEEAGWRCRHPYFGALEIGEWMRFMDVHHRHHLKIVRDIRKAAGV
jgi:hypothetical protein